MSADGRTVPGGAKALSIVLALLAPARMAWIVFKYGENNLSNDYIARVPIVAAILEGRYPPTHLFLDTMIWGGHSWLALLPIYWAEARYFAWDLRVELGLGLFLTALKVFLVWRTASAFVPRAAHWFLLPVLSTLAFSVSLVASFTFGESVLQMQLAQVAVAAGALALARLAGRTGLRAASLAACGLLASWSWGGGVMAWPVFAAALFASGERRLRRWAFLPAAAALGLAQYVWFLVVAPLPAVVKAPGLRGLWRVFDLVGRPFTNGTGTYFGPSTSAIAFGAAGLALAAACVWTSRRALRERLPALAILGWSFLLALQISALRSEIAPWYISPMTVFWLGLALLLAAAPLPLAIAGFATIAAGLLYSNRTWEDKSFYLSSRAPISAACLREWRTAPPGCRARVFQWGEEGNPNELALLGGPLERHRLSVFGPRRTYLLQGDVPFKRVQLKPESAQSFLSADGRTPGDIDDFRRLDLVLAPDSTVSWRVDLPPGTRTARFRSVVRTGPDEALDARGVAVSASAGPDGPTLASRVFLPRGEKRELVLDLTRFSGQTVTLALGAEETQTPGAPLLWEAPRIELALERTK